MWQEPTLYSWWQEKHRTLEGVTDKKHFLSVFRKWFEGVKDREKIYPKRRRRRAHKKPVRVDSLRSEKKIYGLCPVASPDTVCCRLRTIDAVETCPYGCTYCTIQTFYSGVAVFDRDFGKKLKEIELDPDRFYHFGSGQSSDSLVWGNRYGILNDLLSFAESNPNILLELKTKSVNVGDLLKRAAPKNLVCSWSLNTDAIIYNEELDTPNCAERLTAARRVADRGIKVAFHFHPMIQYRDWQREYNDLGERVLKMFQPQEVLFVSFGSVTLIKSVIRALRRWGGNSKILQMPMALDPKGKITYPDAIKVTLFRYMYRVFAPWHNEVFFYLCMEKPSIWREVFGFVYSSNEEFEREFGRRTMSRLE
jgi:spore photoproduct lyase